MDVVAAAAVGVTTHSAKVDVVVIVVVMTVQETVAATRHSATGAATPREKREARIVAVWDFILPGYRKPATRESKSLGVGNDRPGPRNR